MNRSGLKRKAKSLATARRQVREYVRREKNRAGVVQKLVDERTALARSGEEWATQRALDVMAMLAKANTFEEWGFWDRLRYLFSPKSVVKGARDAA
jgi:hypothetical protein